MRIVLLLDFVVGMDINRSGSGSELSAVMIRVMDGIWRIVRNSFVDASTSIHFLSRSRPCSFSVVLWTSKPRQDFIGYIRSETISLDCLVRVRQGCSRRRRGRVEFSGVVFHPFGSFGLEKNRYGTSRRSPRIKGVVIEYTIVVVSLVGFAFAGCIEETELSKGRMKGEDESYGVCVLELA